MLLRMSSGPLSTSTSFLRCYCVSSMDTLRFALGLYGDSLTIGSIGRLERESMPIEDR